MTLISTTPPEAASGPVLEMYQRQAAKTGFVPNYARAFCHRPELMQRWADLLAGIRQHVAPRRFEIATLAAALALQNSYCSLAHATASMRFLDPADVLTLAQGGIPESFDPLDAAIVAYARKVATDAQSVTGADLGALRALGLCDAEIFDLAATVAARAFFTRLLDGLGVVADAHYRSMDPALVRALTVGRPIAAGTRPAD
ncbi:MAG: carboxymuconolactone decarboxylase family protein [Pseudomonadales bacterium]|nr:carboxymuconolactone decarboxylase family protein [Pseudomonadales bacterium]